MSILIDHLALIGGSVWAFVSLLFILSLVIKRNDIADIAWGVGIFLVALISYVLGSQSIGALILTILAGIWGARLATRIFLRNIKKSEDERYKKWRDSWGKWFYIRSYLQVYILQGFLMVVVGYVFVHTSVFGESLSITPLFIAGIAIWLFGFIFETIADYQLDRFIHNPENKGKIMQSGLWKYSRHPNYFGEVSMWWGMWLAVATLPYGLAAIISPLTITFLILKVSGIPMLEKKFEGNPAFAEYKEKTSIFIPLPPKK